MDYAIDHIYKHSKTTSRYYLSMKLNLMKLNISFLIFFLFISNCAMYNMKEAISCLLFNKIEYFNFIE